MKHEPPPAPGAGKEGKPRSGQRFAQAIAGTLLVSATLLVIATELGAPAWAGRVAAALVVAFVLTQLGRLSFSVMILAAAGTAFILFGLLTRSDMPALMEAALVRSTWVMAIFVSLLSLRSAVNDIPGIVRSGLYLVSQRPGRRYAALTLGSQLFSHILQYGAVTLLGGLVTGITAQEPESWVRRARERRMLLAIQRGFVSTLCWSPVAFPMIISTTVIPGSDWLGSAPGALGTSIIIMGVGWFLDALFKPEVRPAPPPMPAIGSLADLLPLAMLFVALCAGTALLVLTTGVSTSVAVLILVPAMAVGIVFVRAGGDVSQRLLAIGEWQRRFALEDAATFSAESMLVIVATFTGILSVDLIGPIVAGIDLPPVPGWLLLVLILWWMPLAGQVGLHPILAASLVGSLVHAPSEFGLQPDQVVVAMTAGWALSGATSPFTAVTLLVARLGRVSATTVGLRWNGLFLIVSGVALSLWLGIEV